jgi:hypothetical protein
VSVDIEVIRYGRGWHAMCEPCRWVSASFETREDAEEMRDIHIERAHVKAS